MNKVMQSATFSILIAWTPASLAAQTCATPTSVIKLATLAPEGTNLHKGLVAIQTRVKAQTSGCVDVLIYAGGTQGDEKDVVRKMRIGQLQGAALTGVGLGMIEPEIRVLELPFLFKNQAQIDRVYAGMRDFFNKKFDEKGFALLGWAETGLVQIFSNKPIAKKADLTGMKMWMWESDPLAEAMYSALEITPVPLAITDVLMSLQTALVDGAYAPPLGAIAFQWHTKTKYVTKVDLVNATGGLIIAKAAWQKLTAPQRQTITTVIDEESKKLTQTSRTDNEESMAVLQSTGLKMVTLDEASTDELRKATDVVRQKLTGTLFSQATLDKVTGLLGP